MTILTKLEHFLASVIFCKSALERLNKEGLGWCSIREATILTGRHKGGNAHFGPYIAHPPRSGGTIRDASEIEDRRQEDALDFYDAFAHTTVRVRDGMNLTSMTKGKNS